MEDNASTKRVVILVAAACVGFVVLTVIAYCLIRQRSPENGVLSSAKPSPTYDEEHQVEAELVATKSDNELDVDSAVEALPSPKKKHFLEKEEAWERAIYLFPGLVEEGHTRIRSRSVEFVVSALLSEKVAKLREQDGAKFEELMQRGKAVELCIELGLNETVVRKRYEAISNLERELNIVSKTPTLVSIQHLIRRIGVNDPFGEAADMNGIIREKYKGKEWLSYLGVQIKKGNVAGALKLVNDLLSEFGYDDSYVHGTTATALLSIVKDGGVLFTSQASSIIRHDFGAGFYCFKGEVQYAVSFAIDRCWPIYEHGSFLKHNPAVVLFPKPHKFTAPEKRQGVVYRVGDQKPFKDSFLKSDLLRQEEYTKFKELEKAISKAKCKEEKYWKEFVILSRGFNIVPFGKRLFWGWLHDHSETTANTDRLRMPKIDKQRLVQYCFTYPVDLGLDRHFIELDVDWNDWISEGTSDEAGV
jgi:hypothetical protein